MRRLLPILLGGAMFAAPAGNKTDIFTASELGGLDRKMAGQKVATHQLATYSNHSLLLAHREGNGQVELHKTRHDVFFIREGAATLALGGTIVNAHNTTKDEVRGDSLKGAEVRKLAPGDTVHIPANVPHQFLLDKGQKISYVAIKIPVD